MADQLIRNGLQSICPLAITAKYYTLRQSLSPIVINDTAIASFGEFVAGASHVVSIFIVKWSVGCF